MMTIWPKLFGGANGGGRCLFANPGAFSPPPSLTFALGYMRASFPFLWVLPLWGAIAGIYFAVAYVYLWRKARVNMWKVWCKMSGDNLRTERRFPEGMRRFPKMNVGYQV